jgi:hypothetical protein
MERPATFVRNPLDSLRGRGKCRRITPTQKRQLAPPVGTPKKLIIVISEPPTREDGTQDHIGESQPGGTQGTSQPGGTQGATGESLLCARG